MKILINPKYSHLEDFLKRIPEIFEKEGRTIYTGRNLIKVMTCTDGTTVNVKRYHAPRGINSLVYSFGLRKPKGIRAFNYSAILLAKDIQTPEAIGYIENRKSGFLAESYLITIQCPYQHTMYEMGNAQKGQYEELAIEFAHFTARMHEHNVLHLDYSPGNILWDLQGGSYIFSIVDINRMHFGYINMRKGCASLRRLWGPKHFFIYIVKEYAKVRGFDVDDSVKIALAKRASFWKRFGKKHKIKFKLEL